MKKQKLSLCIMLILVLSFAYSIALAKGQTGEGEDVLGSYPKRAIEVVLPCGPGTGSEMTARNLLNYVEQELGVEMKYTFKPGAAEAIGTAYAMDQPADGYTFLSQTSDAAINMALGKSKYTTDDFVWLIRATHEVSAIHTRLNNEMFQSFKDVQEYSKANPKAQITIAGSDAMGLDQLWIELLNKEGGVSLKFVPFPSGGNRRASFQGGHTSLQSDELIDMAGLREAGICKPILVGYTERLAQFPDVPSTKELGIENYLGRWRGMVIKKGTPEPIVEYLSEVFTKAFSSEHYQKYLKEKVGHERAFNAYLGPVDFKNFVEEEISVMKDLMKELGYIE